MARKIQPPLNNPSMDGISELVREVMPPHRVYCEPWFLGGEVFFRKRPSAVEIINDTDNRVIDFYMVARSRPKELAFLIENTLYCDALVELADDIHNGRWSSDALYRAWSVWMHFQACKQGAMAWMNETGACLASADIRPRSSMALDGYLAERLERVALLNRDAAAAIDGADGRDTLFYFHPPGRKELAALGTSLPGLKGRFALYYHEKTILERFARSFDLIAEENDRGQKGLRQFPEDAGIVRCGMITVY